MSEEELRRLAARVSVMEDLLASAIATFAAKALGSDFVHEWVLTAQKLAALRNTGSAFQVEYRTALEAFLAKVRERLGPESQGTGQAG